MPSHLRNGKDLSFEQQREAKRAAKRDQQLYQQAAEPPSIARLPCVDKQPRSVDHQKAVEYPSAAVDGLPSAYTLSPAALKRLRRAQEKSATFDGFQQAQPAGSDRNRPADIPPALRSGPVGDQFPGHFPSSFTSSLHSSPSPGGQTGLSSHARRSADSQATHYPSPASPSQRLSHSHAEPTRSEKINIHMMRIALNQAIITQEALKALIGIESMLEIADGWSARHELSHLNQAHPPMSLQPNPGHQETHPQRALNIKQLIYPSSQERYTSTDRDTLMRTATSQQHVALPPPPPLAPPPPPPSMIATVPMSPSTGPLLGQNTAPQTSFAPPIPPRPEEQNYQYHLVEPQNHQQMDWYYEQVYYSNQPH
ncbi:hypothetical protein PCANC_26939 [Puccinia coronata f. sp. avenae]|uniref:Uncharacterized protein n=1 Tax=Puccinia coronata f. sp. avenae TaxID=200324 RepID=A0A2N5U2S2_9BASI|nr:hypothetical protein PCANC_26939 [Puccinia coronata f. sp. avenae]